MNKFLSIFLIVMVQCVFTQIAYAQQCFNDVKTAYDHLMAQELNDDEYKSKNKIGLGVNINTASESELTTLKDIGSKKAQDIILYREGLGYFKNVDELAKVKGIGNKTVENNRSRLTVK